MDFKDSPGRTAAHEPDDAREGHPRPASGLGKFVGIPPAAGERRQVDGQLGDVRGHDRGRWRVLEGELHQRILCGHRRNRKHAHEDRHRAVGIGEGAETNAKPQARRQGGRVQDQKRPPRPVAHLVGPPAS